MEEAEAEAENRNLTDSKRNHGYLCRISPLLVCVCCVYVAESRFGVARGVPLYGERLSMLRRQWWKWWWYMVTRKKTGRDSRVS